ncbi:hypothetical protein diail_11808 [Diaporthe ilicicola]|nr:hypothetical protein diail_11808 [Diaporthe ilicicola]
MPITALPETTVRLLGSAAAISTPVDVIKELLDNALDAGATSVEILVSENLVDSIQVRDNGHGIQAGDYDSLGRMGHTSKLTSFEELHNFGGNTLGFRGHALASTNSLGRVIVVTRSIGDPTAVRLTVLPGVGGIEDRQRASAPVGTTVSVTGLFKLIPVREQVAVKEAQKNLAKAKLLLDSYALARPLIRISLKILGGNIKQTYSPHPKASVREAVAQVFGASLTSQCVLKTVATEAADRKEGSAIDAPELIIEAVLPRPDADLSKLSKGAFFSVDSRPVSTSRGTMKKLLSNFKTHFRRSLGVDAEDRRLSDLFICVNIKCCPGTYDPNVEPSKNQVLFSNEPQLVALFEELCSGTYQAKKTVEAFETIEKRPLTSRTQTRTPPPSSDGPQESTRQRVSNLDEPFQDTLNQSPTISQNRTFQQHLSPSSTRNPLATRDTMSDQVHPRYYQGRKRGFVVNMLADPELSSDEEAETCAPGSCDLRETETLPEELGDNSKEALNPWTIAKMTAPARHKTAEDIAAENVGQGLVGPQGPHALPIADDAFKEELPILRPQRGPPGDLDTPRVMRFTNSHMDRLQALDARHHEQVSTPFGRPQAVIRPDLEESIDPDGLVQTPLSFDKPRESQRRQKDQARLHIDEIPTRRNPPLRKSKRVRERGRNYPLDVACTSSGREDHPVESRNSNNIPDYPVRDHRHFDSPQSPGFVPMNFGANRAVHLPTEQQLDPGHTNTTKFDADPRKYLMKRQRSEAAHRRKGRRSITRTKTNQLPLETLSSGDGAQHLVLTLAQDTMKSFNVSKRTISLIEYRGRVSFGASMSLEDVDDVRSRLQTVISSWTEKVFGEKRDIEINLRGAVKGNHVDA